MCIPMPWPDAYMAMQLLATWLLATWLHGYMATWLRAISMATLVPDYQEGARSAIIITRPWARALAKFGEVDTVPVSENSLKYNTFC